MYRCCEKSLLCISSYNLWAPQNTSCSLSKGGWGCIHIHKGNLLDCLFIKCQPGPLYKSFLVTLISSLVSLASYVERCALLNTENARSIPFNSYALSSCFETLHLANL